MAAEGEGVKATGKRKRVEGGRVAEKHKAAAMATHPALADLGIAPRLLTREQAAAYCGDWPYNIYRLGSARHGPGPCSQDS